VEVRYNLKKYVSNEFEFVAFNLSNKILKEREVRTAIAYAVDREQIISSILPGRLWRRICRYSRYMAQ